MSLPRQYRLTEKRAFREIFEKPCVVSDPCFKILAKPNGQDYSRLALAVSRKVDKRAVQRNRLKRLIRESFRQHIVAGALSTAADFMVLPRQQAVTISNEEVFERLGGLWNNVSRKLMSA
ncbi:MAG: ribonuclease P protein component [Xanthomonadales bacterium]|nr:ribonuclease P protein component [Xanthomonadales bacterium]